MMLDCHIMVCTYFILLSHNIYISVSYRVHFYLFIYLSLFIYYYFFIYSYTFAFLLVNGSHILTELGVCYNVLQHMMYRIYHLCGLPIITWYHTICCTCYQLGHAFYHALGVCVNIIDWIICNPLCLPLLITVCKAWKL